MAVKTTCLHSLQRFVHFIRFIFQSMKQLIDNGWLYTFLYSKNNHETYYQRSRVGAYPCGFAAGGSISLVSESTRVDNF
jgi:hypothetical protein